MKSLLSHLRPLALTLLALSSASAQDPMRVISYQGVLTSGDGTISDGTHTIALTLYSAPTDGSALYTESHTVVTTAGLFSLSFGAINNGIPTAVAFDKQYWLGLSVDGGAELAPRTPLASAPYALNAEVAQSLAPGAAGAVTLLNGTAGAVTIEGAGGTTVNRNGNTITISAATLTLPYNDSANSTATAFKVANKGSGPALEVSSGAVLFSGTSGNTPTNGPGARMMWVPAKRAFRAGEAPGTSGMTH